MAPIVALHPLLSLSCAVLLLSLPADVAAADTNATLTQSHGTASTSFSSSPSSSPSPPGGTQSRTDSRSQHTASLSGVTRTLAQTRTATRGVDTLGVISIVPASLLTIPVSCLLDRGSTDYDNECRSVSFAIRNDTFLPFSPAFQSFVRAERIVPLEPSPIVTPFGVYAMRGEWQGKMAVASNRTHLTLTFPSLPFLDVVFPEFVLINLTTAEIIGSGRTPPGGSEFLVRIQPGSDPSPFILSDVAQAITGIVGAAAIFLPFPNAVVDSQLAVLAGTSYCFQSDIRGLSERGFRLVLAGSTVADAPLQWLLAASVGVGVVFGLQCVTLLGTRVRHSTTQRSWRDLMHMTWFPSGVLSVAIFLLPGLFVASARSVLYPSANPDHRLLAVAGGLAGMGGVVALVATVGSFAEPVYRSATSRCSGYATRDFPVLLKAYMPARTWGPPAFVRALHVPFFCFREYLPYPMQCVLSMVFSVLGAAVFAFVAESRRACALQSVAMLCLTTAHCLCILWWRPYRSLLQCAGACLNSVALFVLMAVNLSRCAVTTQGPMLTASLAVLVVHLTSALRCCLNVVCGVLERRVVLPRTWPDDGSACYGVAGTAPWIAAFASSPAVLGGTTGGKDAGDFSAVDLAILSAARLPSPDELRELEDIRPSAEPVTLTQTDDDRHMNILTAHAKSRAVLGEVPAMVQYQLPPMPAEIYSQRSASLRTIASAHAPPMQRLLAGEGPMPPMLLTQQQLQYQLL